MYTQAPGTVALPAFNVYTCIGGAMSSSSNCEHPVPLASSVESERIHFSSHTFLHIFVLMLNILTVKYIYTAHIYMYIYTYSKTTHTHIGTYFPFIRPCMMSDMHVRASCLSYIRLAAKHYFACSNFSC